MSSCETPRYSLDHGLGFAPMPRDIRNLEPLMRESSGSAIKAWVIVLARATHEPKWVQPAAGRERQRDAVHLEPGQCLVDLRKLGESIGRDKNAADRALEKLAKLGLITRKAGHSGTIVTVVNYDAFGERDPAKRDTSGTQAGHKRDTSGTKEPDQPKQPVKHIPAAAGSPPGEPGAGVSAGQGQEGASHGEPGAGVDHGHGLGAEPQAAEPEPPPSRAQPGKRAKSRQSADNTSPLPSVALDPKTADSGAVIDDGGVVGESETPDKAPSRTKRAPGQAKAELESVLLDAINAARAQYGLTPQGVNGPIKAIRDAAGRMAGKWTADQVRTAVVLRVKELKPEWVKADTILRIDRFTAALEIVRDNAQPNATTATGPGTKPPWQLEQERQQAQGGIF